MRLLRQIPRRVAPVLLLLVLTAPPAAASTIIPPRDLGELARLSDAVVLVRAGSAQALVQGRSLFTLTDFEVLQRVSGPLAAGETVSVASPGGRVDGVSSVVAGAPRFTSGETYLLFLSRDRQGQWRPRLMAYGILKQTLGLDGRPLLAPMAEAANLSLARRADGVRPERVGTYRQEALLAHLGPVARAELSWNARQVVAPADVLFDGALPEISSSKNGQGAPQGCSFLGPEYGMKNMRWDLFDGGAAIEVRAQAGGDGYYAEEEAFEQIKSAMTAWQSVDGTSVNWTFSGSMEVPEDECSDGTAFSYPAQDVPNLIVFNDPCEEIVAFTGNPDILAYTDVTATTVGGNLIVEHDLGEEKWTTINSFRIITREGLAENYSPEEYRQILLHELGHGLGFDHTSEERSVMYGFYGGGTMPIGDLGKSCARHAYDVQFVETEQLPVELARFDVRLDGAAARLAWRTSSEANNSGFEVQHAVEDGAFAEVGFVAGHGTTAEAQDYAFELARLEPGRHRFRLKQLDLDGAFSYSAEVEVVVGVPEAFALSDVWPNPFNPRAQFTLSLQAAQDVRVEVFDAQGRRVALLHDGFLEADRAHRFTLEADGLPSGVYFYRATGEAFQAAKPATLVK